jgi:glycosyltransferase involved in cell wall biosynthesis
MSENSISVIIPTYNRAHMIHKAINSAISQTTISDEIIVVDDGSNDHTEKLVSNYGDKIRYFKIDHSGAGRARNFGISKARNHLVSFLDSDDEWMPNKIKVQRDFMEANHEILFCFTNLAFRKKNGEIIHYSLNNWPGVNKTWDHLLKKEKKLSYIIDIPSDFHDCHYYTGYLYKAFLTGCYMSVITLMVRREQAGESLRFAEDLKTYEDWECFARLTKAGRGAYLDCETAWNNGHSGDRLTDFGGIERFEALTKILERVYGQDDKFLKENGKFFKNKLDVYRTAMIKGFILNGRIDDAKKEIKKLNKSNFALKLLLSLPPSITLKLSQIIYHLRHNFLK